MSNINYLYFLYRFDSDEWQTQMYNVSIYFKYAFMKVSYGLYEGIKINSTHSSYSFITEFNDSRI